jgi:hypothetical protein
VCVGGGGSGSDQTSDRKKKWKGCQEYKVDWSPATLGVAPVVSVILCLIS